MAHLANKGGFAPEPGQHGQDVAGRSARIGLINGQFPVIYSAGSEVYQQFSESSTSYMLLQMLKVNLPAKYKPGEIKKHRTRRPCGKRKKRFIPVMAEKEFPLLSRPAETSKVDGASGCEQVWHISLTPSTQEMPIKMRRQNSAARGTRGTQERVSPTGQMPPYGHLWARLLLLPPIPPQQTRIFKAFQASLREFNPFQACVMVTVFRIFLHDSLPIL